MNRSVAFGLVALVSAGIGAGVSYLVTKKVVSARYDAIIDKELNEARAYYKRFNKKEEYSSPVEVLRSYQTPDMVEEETGTYVTFGNPADIVTEDGWDQEAEEAKRSDEAPYVISKDEWLNTRPEYEKADYLYYAEDDIVIDAGTVPLRDVDSLLGPDFMDKFGYGSGNRNLVYIRNEELETDFEITRTTNDFSEEVLGYIEHDDRRKVHKFHRDRE